LCRWCPPDIAVITAIGPVHLERFHTEARIVEAKSEILVPAADVVLQVDDGRLAALADRAAAEGKRVLRCSTVDPIADVCVVRSDDGRRLSVRALGEGLAEDVGAPPGLQTGNLACAIAVALVLEVEPQVIAARLHDLPPVEHRLEVVRAPSGVTILDDTYNANPAGASEALAALERSTTDAPPSDSDGGRQGHRRVVVTPGMVELGPRQVEENRRFAVACATVATDLLVVGRTNRHALVSGAGSADGSALAVRPVRGRDQAVVWVRQNLGPGDAVLYENDLPDHYP
jgi:UDP-N-acetylmuramoyl-tripeptide--D-alanyl-D-alanine ligase